MKKKINQVSLKDYLICFNIFLKNDNYYLIIKLFNNYYE